MFAGLDKITHGSNLHDGKIAIHVRLHSVIRPEALVYALLGPDTAHRCGGIENDEIDVGIEREGGFGGGQAVPAYCNDVRGVNRSGAWVGI
jgi:hypothetical protein